MNKKNFKKCRGNPDIIFYVLFKKQYEFLLYNKCQTIHLFYS